MIIDLTSIDKLISIKFNDVFSFTKQKSVYFMKTIILIFNPKCVLNKNCLVTTNY